MTAPDARTACLVLDGRARPLRIGVIGRALAVEAEGAAAVLHPVARLDRVVLLGEATLAADALRALASAGCPLGLVARDGRLVAALLPLEARRASLAEALDRLARRRDWRGRLDDWRRSRVAALARGLVPDPSRIAARAGTEPPAQLIFGAAASGPRREALAREMRAHATLAAAAALLGAGAPPRWCGAAGDPDRNLVPMFGQIALWHLGRQLRRPAAQAALAAAQAADARTRAPGAGPATLRLAALAEPGLRRALGWELRQFHAWLLDIAFGLAGEEGRTGWEWAG